MSYLINEIEEQSLVSEMAVIDSLVASYVKEATMLEYTDQTIVDECIYQEAKSDGMSELFNADEMEQKFKKDLNKSPLGEKGENIFKRILLFIPRLINAIIKNIKMSIKSDKICKALNDSNIKNRVQNNKLLQQELARFCSERNLKSEQVTSLKQCLRQALDNEDKFFVPECYDELMFVLMKVSVDLKDILDQCNQLVEICDNADNDPSDQKISEIDRSIDKIISKSPNINRSFLPCVDYKSLDSDAATQTRTTILASTKKVLMNIDAIKNIHIKYNPAVNSEKGTTVNKCLNILQKVSSHTAKVMKFVKNINDVDDIVTMWNDFVLGK